MSYNLFLDDVRCPSGAYVYTCNEIFKDKEWIIVRSYEEFVEYIEVNGQPDFISYDHDLADIHYDPMTQRESFEYHEMTGLECTKWYIDYCIENDIRPCEYFVHSANPVGANNIRHYINNYLRALDKGII